MFSINNKFISLFFSCILIFACNDDHVFDNTNNSTSDKTDSPKTILITGYLKSNTVKADRDWSFLNCVDRIFFFGLSPNEKGMFKVDIDYITNYNIVREKIKPNQKLHVVIGTGGTVANMHVMGNDKKKREAYVDNLVLFIERYPCDGIDIDWETDWDTGQKVSTENLIALIEYLKKKLPNKMKITVALSRSDMDTAFAIQHLVEDMSIMIYSTLNKEGLHSPLYTVKEIMQKYNDKGIINNKLSVGVPFYGRHKNGKAMKYRDIVPYLSLGDLDTNMWEGFSSNSVNDMKEKVQFIKEKGYRGIMIWELDQDVPVSNQMSLLKGIYEKNVFD